MCCIHRVAKSQTRLNGTPSPPVSVSLFSMSASLFLPCKQVHRHHFSRFHIHALIPSSFLFLIFFPRVTDSRFIHITYT